MSSLLSASACTEPRLRRSNLHCDSHCVREKCRVHTLPQRSTHRGRHLLQGAEASLQFLLHGRVLQGLICANCQEEALHCCHGCLGQCLHCNSVLIWERLRFQSLKPSLCKRKLLSGLWSSGAAVVCKQQRLTRTASHCWSAHTKH